MAYRSGLDIKKETLRLLKERPYVISEIERKINTSDRVINRHLAELEYLELVKIKNFSKSENTGRPYKVAELKRD